MPRLDWHWAITYAFRHGLSPLLYRTLGRLIHNFSSIKMIQGKVSDPNLPPGINQDWFNMLFDSYMSTLRRNSHIQSALKELDETLADIDITCIIWKGAALINGVYPDIGLRPMDDIDVLVPKKHIEKFKKVIRQLGFIPRPAYPLTWNRREIVLDLHLDVVHSERISSRLTALPITAETLLPETLPLSNFKKLLTLSPQDDLICIATHALKHGFSRDIWLIDAVNLLTQYPEIIRKPENLIQRAQDLKATFPLYILFSLLETCPVNLDLGFICRLRPKKFGFFARLFVRSLKNARQIPYAGEIFYLFLLDSYQQQISFLLETMFPSRQVMRQLFPDKRFMPYWFYYPHRILRLVGMGMETFKALFHYRANEKQLHK
ncbi:MAG: nucleotidyltransferase family protein [Desulfobacterales bacterium]|uniref:Nucleotidyltransferase family protein n=1 Tax=Candidatus Desulfatibia vada TaxID=2841696 RepID=A0A8J6NQL6_9BACT|nr:nucleotidyltransferase family protein [Candidatus Desulfatibia vada]MBL6970961.1 nucleotidyltransferase family protein [Desulfobacterales bacterium]